jgi:hypothetical protein
MYVQSPTHTCDQGEKYNKIEYSHLYLVIVITKAIMKQTLSHNKNTLLNLLKSVILGISKNIPNAIYLV